MSPRLFLDQNGQPNVLVVGDLILDRYTWGDAQSTREPRGIRPGPSASTAKKSASAGRQRGHAVAQNGGADVSLAGVIGDDPEGGTLIRLLEEEGIETHEFLSVDPTRPTTTKERFVGRAANRHPHQILRVDHETRQSIGPETEQWILQRLVPRLDEFQAVLVSDYAKGVCTPGLLQALILAATERRIPVIVDPARLADCSRYRGATLLKPNRLEAELATGLAIGTPEDALAAGQKLHREYRLGSVLVTLDHDGMVLVTSEDGGEHFPTVPRTVYDITGAGDMALATLGLCLALRVSLPESVMLANVAAGLEVERFGVAPVSRQEIANVLARREKVSAIAAGRDSEPSVPGSSKVITLSELLPRVHSFRAAGKSVVFTNGCFDLLHVGHVRCLQEAAALGDLLIVAINSDPSVRRLKSEGRPVIKENDRAAMVSALHCVDHVLIFDDPTPHRLLEAIRPDVLAKGGTTGEIVGHEVVEAYGGCVCRVSESSGVSTTAIVSRINSEIRNPNSEIALTTGH